jgi:4-hydroxy-2-oxoheptanedioate aldolase
VKVRSTTSGKWPELGGFSARAPAHGGLYDARMSTDRLREIWAGGGVVINAWLTLEGVSAASVVSAAGFDSVTLDLQHGAATAADASEIVAAIEQAGSVPLARPAWNEPAGLMRLLDVGARGLICPMVSTRGEAERFVGACRYPPLGIRSYGPIRGALAPGAEHVRRSNETVLTFAMIETADGFANLDEIAATPGLEGLHVGPADLSLALGLSTFADLTDPQLLGALDEVVAAATRHGIVAGVHAPSPERAVEMAACGFTFVTAAADADLLGRAAADALTRTRAGLERSSIR